MKSISLPLFAVVSFAFPSCNRGGETADASFARSTFESLAKGDTAVQDRIDWPTLTSLGENVGLRYSEIPTETEKAQFRSGFITQFAASFRDNGGSIESFTNWRVTFSDPTRSEVAADSPGGLLKLTVSERDSVERISAIDIVK